MKILIIKFGALGDVVRTSYFARMLKESRNADREVPQIFWLTAPGSVPLLRLNPYIDAISTDPSQLLDIHFDVVYSLDDEQAILDSTKDYSRSRLVGAYVDPNNRRGYCELSAPWFDMGLLSVYGKNEADQRKKMNQRTHAAIFSEIFETNKPTPHFYNSSAKEEAFKRFCGNAAKGRLKVAVNAFAGQRWPSKSLLNNEFVALVKGLCSLILADSPIHIFLIGGTDELARNKSVAAALRQPCYITIVDTSSDVLDLAALVNSMDLVISSDSLALHLAIAQQIPTVCFFSPTAAAEIENLPYVAKVVSTHNDYCSYSPSADNSTITAQRLLEATVLLMGSLG